MELEFCCWFVWSGWEVSSVLHGNVFFMLRTHGLKTVIWLTTFKRCVQLFIPHTCCVTYGPVCGRVTWCVSPAVPSSQRMCAYGMHFLESLVFQQEELMLLSFVGHCFNPWFGRNVPWWRTQSSDVCFSWVLKCRERGSRRQSCRYYDTETITLVTTTALG